LNNKDCFYKFNSPVRSARLAEMPGRRLCGVEGASGGVAKGCRPYQVKLVQASRKLVQASRRMRCADSDLGKADRRKSEK
jgi:hypothetical protein